MAKKTTTSTKKTSSEKNSSDKKTSKTASLGRKAPSNSIKKNREKSAIAKKKVVKKTGRKLLSESELAQKEANRIINSTPKSKSAKRPSKTRTISENTKLLDAIIAGLEEKKAKNILVMDLKNTGNTVADFFVIADADSRTHVEAIADSVEELVVKKNGEKAFHIEGQRVGEWIIIDYINVVVHVFQKEIREFYSLESLLADAEFKKIN